MKTFILCLLYAQITAITTQTANMVVPNLLVTAIQREAHGCDIDESFNHDALEWCKTPTRKRSSSTGTVYPPMTVCAVKNHLNTSCFACYHRRWHQTNCDVVFRQKRAVGAVISAVVALAPVALKAAEFLIGLFSSKDSTPAPPPKPPQISCPRIGSEYFVPAGQSGAVVAWPNALAIDEYGHGLPIEAHGGESGSSFIPGDHTISFVTRDSNGFNAYCFVRFVVKIKICPYLSAPANGRRECNASIVTLGRKCQFTCDRGYQLVGQTTLTCLDSEQYDVTPPTCEAFDCGALQTPENGKSFDCPDGTKYQDTCSVTCQTGYRLALASYTFCRLDGNWQKPLPTCEDNAAPVFDYCPPTITAYAGEDETTTVVNWQQPKASDNSGEVQVILEHGTPNGFPFTVGAHSIKYSATDNDGNVAYCFFVVSVQVIRCNFPTYDDDNIDIHCPSYTYGSECSVGCRFGLPLEGPSNITCDKDSSVPPQGYWNHGSGTMPACKETKCPKLTPPLNGALACADWLSGSFCNMMCNNKFDIPRTVTESPNFLCGWTNGKWSSQDVPDCTERKNPRRMMLPSELYYYDGNCSSAETQNQIQQNFMQYITNSHWKDQCLQDKECKVENVRVECGETTRRKRSLHPWSRFSRKRRSLAEGTVVITWNFVIDFNTTEAMSVESARSLHDNALMDMAVVVETDLKAGLLNNIAPGFNVRDDSMFIDWADFECPEGQVAQYNTVSCHGCPTGTHYDAVIDGCAKCEVGTYQDVDSSATCISCPSGASTVSEGSRNNTDCREVCPAGTSSPTGLAPCADCSAGFYQPGTGSKNCKVCPVDTSSQPTSTNIAACQVYDVLMKGPRELQVSTIVSIVGDFTLSLWLQVSQVSTAGIILAFSTVTENNRLLISFGNMLKVQVLGSEFIEAPLSVKWNHVTVVWKQMSKQMSVYTGGVLRQTKTFASLQSNLVPSGTTVTLHLSADDSILFRSMDLLPSASDSTTVTELSEECSSSGLDSIFNLRGIKTTGPGLELVSPSTCTVIDVCSTLPCGEHTCRSLPRGFVCECDGGYTGETCSQEPNLCLGNHCLNGATCISQGGVNYTCHCPQGYRGARCEIQIVDGGWGPWTAWSECSVTCGSGVRVQTRNCDNPTPDANGQPCEGIGQMTTTCDQPACALCSKDDLILAPSVESNCSFTGINELECNLQCTGGTVFVEEPPLYTCEEGIWSPGITTKPCTKILSPSTVNISTVLSYDDADCTKLDTDTIINYLGSSVECVKNERCDYNVLAPFCGITLREKRQATAIELKIDMWINLPGGEINIFGVNGSSTDAGQLKLITDAFLDLDKSANELKNNYLNVSIDGSDVPPISVDITGSVTCPPGSMSTAGVCVVCPVGTYGYDNRCIDCSKGFYENEASSTSCKVCPPGYTTSYPAAISIDMCSVQI